jgi:hypothetical protein
VTALRAVVVVFGTGFAVVVAFFAAATAAVWRAASAFFAASPRWAASAVSRAFSAACADA